MNGLATAHVWDTLTYLRRYNTTIGKDHFIEKLSAKMGRLRNSSYAYFIAILLSSCKLFENSDRLKITSDQ
jgi:hypothetical protein